MSVPAMKQALEALELGRDAAFQAAEMFHLEMRGYMQQRHEALDAEVKQIDEAITALRSAIEAAESQRPVAWMYDKAKYPPNDLRGQQWAPALWFFEPYTGNGMAKNVRPLYTTPPAPTPDPLHLSRILHELAGAASMCWTPAPTGVFDSQEAIKHVVAAIEEIRARSNT